jgi:integrase/recombinase XerD
MTFAGIRTPIELRLITRAHVIAWRKDLDARKLAPGSVRRKLSAISSLYEYLTDQNAVPTNPVKGVKRPKVDSYEGKTPAIADKEARQLMNLLPRRASNACATAPSSPPSPPTGSTNSCAATHWP